MHLSKRDHTLDPNELEENLSIYVVIHQSQQSLITPLIIIHWSPDTLNKTFIATMSGYRTCKPGSKLRCTLKSEDKVFVLL